MRLVGRFVHASHGGGRAASMVHGAWQHSNLTVLLCCSPLLRTIRSLPPLSTVGRYHRLPDIPRQRGATALHRTEAAAAGPGPAGRAQPGSQPQIQSREHPVDRGEHPHRPRPPPSGQCRTESKAVDKVLVLNGKACLIRPAEVCCLTNGCFGPLEVQSEVPYVTIGSKFPEEDGVTEETLQDAEPNIATYFRATSKPIASWWKTGEAPPHFTLQVALPHVSSANPSPVGLQIRCTLPRMLKARQTQPTQPSTLPCSYLTAV